METEFIPIDYDSFDFEGKNYVKIIGRDSKERKICVIDECDLFLWAILKEGLGEKEISSLIKKIEKIKIETKARISEIIKIEICDKTFLNKPVKALKIFSTNYKDLKEIANKLDFDEIDKRRGHDLGYITHYIIESEFKPLTWYKISGEDITNSFDFGFIGKGLENVFQVLVLKEKKEMERLEFNPKVLSYDIETDSIKIGQGEILMVSLVSNQGFKKVLTWKKTTKKVLEEVEFVKDEAELIEKFCFYVREENPDFLVGYFSDNFDLPFLKARAKKNEVKLSLGVDNSEPKFSRSVQGITSRINGITHIDLLRFIKTAYSQYLQSETLSLNEIAKEFLKDTKKEFEIKHSSKILDGEWPKYFEYNLHDSFLTTQLFEKFFQDMVEFTKITQEPIFDLTRAGLSKYTESYILHNLKKFNEIPERRPGHSEIIERKSRGRVKGAFVLEPTPGLYEDIAMFDFTSMHTSIILTHNLSKPSYLEKKEKNSFESPEIVVNNEKLKFYFSNEKNFFTKLLEQIFELRTKYKSEYKKNPSYLAKARSNAFKVLSASVHGYIGFFGARYYSYEASSTILALVREYNQKVIANTEQNGFTPIYSDTDSVAFLLNKKKKSQVKDYLNKLNDSLPGVMHLELEDFYKRGLFVTTRGGEIGAKKKYALINDSGELKIRGFETVRRDWCSLARKMQNKVLKLVLEEGNEEKALVYIKKVIKKLKNREIDKKNLLIKTQLTKPISEYKSISPHVVAAQKMKELKVPISQGSLIEYYIAETKRETKLVREKVKLLREEGLYDITYYLERQIIPAVEGILQVFGIKAKDLIEEHKQMSLMDF
jgi:DNA polymerase elongation subunit (family B)